MKLCGFEVGLDQPLFLIAGPCVIESMQLQLDTAGTLKEITGRLGIPFVFSSNGDGFVFHDRTGASQPREANLGLDAFPSPADLWARYRAWKGLDPQAEKIVLQDYYTDTSNRAPLADSSSTSSDAPGYGPSRYAFDSASTCDASMPSAFKLAT